jgi:hypothetical protein
MVELGQTIPLALAQWEQWQIVQAAADNADQRLILTIRMDVLE